MKCELSPNSQFKVFPKTVSVKQDQMKKGRVYYSNDSKQEVLRMTNTTDKSISDVGYDLGLMHGLIRNLI